MDQASQLESAESTRAGVPGRLGIEAWARSTLNLIFPPGCVACRAELLPSCVGPAFCPTCRHAVLSFATCLCKHCGRSRAIQSEGPCSKCRQESNAFDQVISLGTHRGALRDAIVRMKNAGNSALTAALGKLMAERAASRWNESPPDLLVKVPMHWRRRML